MLVIKHKKKLPKIIAIVTVVVIGLVVGATILKPLPEILPPSFTTKTLLPSKDINLDWPNQGSAAVGALGYGDDLINYGSVEPRPIASIAKLMVALAVVKQKPLQLNESGPLITISQQDIDFYNNQISQGGNVVAVNIGEQISQYQALQALLIASGNNIAETLASWAFGSIEGYQEYAKQLAKDLGLTSSVFLDPSGLNANTTSSATDLLKVAEAVMQEPVLAQVVSQPSANIPVAGIIKSTNRLLGQEGIVGIKTGHTDEAGGCFLLAATKNISGKDITILTSVLGELTISSALSESLELTKSTFNNFEVAQPVTTGQKITIYQAPWGSQITIVAKAGSEIIRWVSDSVTQDIELTNLEPISPSGTKAGELTIKYGAQSQTLDLITSKAVDSPSFWWRLKHLFDF